ncbi:ATP-dependent helicase brm-like [Heterocephalus glaber]|uniref:ATP-dependent helicase brm-like n=1 Tax=Heterocephalus glaber TaxID=10181 RepID=A0AAX6T9F8_HETGA|nr:ATP-dependent helicase brm-like [Heterocephalus glaber]
MVDGGQNQFLALPPCLKRKIQTSWLHHTAGHQAGEVPFVPLDRQQSKAAKFLSHLNEEEQDWHQQLPEVVVGTPHQLEKPKFQEQISQEKDIYTSMDGGEHDSLDLESQENSEEPPEAPAQTTPQFQLEAQSLHPEMPQVQSFSPQQETTAPFSQCPEEGKPSSTQGQPDLAAEEGVEQLSVPQEVKAPSLGRREVCHSQELGVTVNVLVKNRRPTPAGKEAQPPPHHQQAPSPPLEPPEEVELSPTQAVDPSQHPHEPPSESVAPPPAQYDITVSFQGQNQAVLPSLPSVTSDYLDVEATITPVHTAEGELPTGLQRSAAVQERPAEVTLPPPNLILGTVGPVPADQLSLSLNLQCLLRWVLQVLVRSPLNITHHSQPQAHLPTWIPAALLCPPQRLHTLHPCRNLQPL